MKKSNLLKQFMAVMLSAVLIVGMMSGVGSYQVKAAETDDTGVEEELPEASEKSEDLDQPETSDSSDDEVSEDVTDGNTTEDAATEDTTESSGDDGEKSDETEEPSPTVTYYQVTVIGGSTVAQPEDGYKEKDTVTIKAEVPEGKQFKEWSTETESVEFIDSASAETTFTMPASDVTVTAEFEDMIPVHQHEWNSAWESDDDYHWHNCMGDDCFVTDDSGKDGYAEHTYIKKSVTPATTQAPGSRVFQCSECGHEKTVDIPQIDDTHIHNTEDADWESDETFHWQECIDCGDAVEKAVHTESVDGVVTKPATESEEGTQIYKCTVCGRVLREVVIPKTGKVGINEAIAPEAPLISISNTPESFKQAVLSEEDKALIAAGTDIDIILSVRDGSDSSKDILAIKSKLNDYTDGDYFDISLMKMIDDGTNDSPLIQNISETNEEIRITITIPEHLRNTDNTVDRIYAVIRVHNGEAEYLPIVSSGENTITIATDKFSTYAIVYKDIKKSSGNDNAGDNGNNTGDNGNNTGNNGNNTGDNGSNTGNNGNNTGDNGSNIEDNGINTGDNDSNIGNDNSDTDNDADVDDDDTESNDDNQSKKSKGKDNEPKTGEESALEIYATVAMIAGLSYVLLYFIDGKSGLTEEEKKELVSRLVLWAKRGGHFRKLLAVAAIFMLLAYYHSIGKRVNVEWKEVYGD